MREVLKWREKTWDFIKPGITGKGRRWAECSFAVSPFSEHTGSLRGGVSPAGSFAGAQGLDQVQLGRSNVAKDFNKDFTD